MENTHGELCWVASQTCTKASTVRGDVGVTSGEAKLEGWGSGDKGKQTGRDGLEQGVKA